MYYVIIFFSYVIIYQKGYQDTEKPYSSVTTKVKGTSLTNLTNVLNQSFPLYGGVHLWDSEEYIIPPEVKYLRFSTSSLLVLQHFSLARLSN